MNNKTAKLLLKCAEKTVRAPLVHSYYRQLKREWVKTSHREKAKLRRRLERGLLIYLRTDTTVPKCRIPYRIAERKRAAKRKNRGMK